MASFACSGQSCGCNSFAARTLATSGVLRRRSFWTLGARPQFSKKVNVAAHWHTFQVLTKRSERMRDLLQSRLQFAAGCEHIWWGVSVENRKHGLPRIDHLRAARPRVAFLSIEPLLEDLGPIDLDHIHWVIVGGESGPGARPMHRDWVLSLRNQCRRAKVPFFFKQRSRRPKIQIRPQYRRPNLRRHAGPAQGYTTRVGSITTVRRQ